MNMYYRFNLSSFQWILIAEIFPYIGFHTKQFASQWRLAEKATIFSFWFFFYA